MRKRCRTITVEGLGYRWHRYHRHTFTPDGAKQCHEILAVYDIRSKRAPVRFVFGEQPGWCVGYPLAGVLEYNAGETWVGFNLNRPAMVAALIGVALQEGWDPFRKPLEFTNRFDLVLKHCQAASGYG